MLVPHIRITGLTWGSQVATATLETFSPRNSLVLEECFRSIHRETTQRSVGDSHAGPIGKPDQRFPDVLIGGYQQAHMSPGKAASGSEALAAYRTCRRCRRTGCNQNSHSPKSWRNSFYSGKPTAKSNVVAPGRSELSQRKYQSLCLSGVPCLRLAPVYKAIHIVAMILIQKRCFSEPAAEVSAATLLQVRRRCRLYFTIA